MGYSLQKQEEIKEIELSGYYSRNLTNWTSFSRNSAIKYKRIFEIKRTIYICIETENVICKLCELCT